jgi:plasmid stabilization system protein ParE
VAPLEIVFRLEALADINDAAIFYGQKDEDGRLAIRFLRAIDHAVEKASANPRAYAKIYRDFRRVVVYRFPFCVYFVPYRDKVEIFGIVHAKRNPDFLRRRLG